MKTKNELSDLNERRKFEVNSEIRLIGFELYQENNFLKIFSLGVIGA